MLYCFVFLIILFIFSNPVESLGWSELDTQDAVTMPQLVGGWLVIGKIKRDKIEKIK
jgi:hypothetical protein